MGKITSLICFEPGKNHYKCWMLVRVLFILKMVLQFTGCIYVRVSSVSGSCVVCVQMI